MLLINFGTFWDPLAANTTAYLNETNQKSGQERGFAMLGLLCEPDTAGIRRSIADLAEPWPQAFVGPLSNPIASAYGIDNENASACVLIGPDGKILAGELFREKIEPAIRQALAGMRNQWSLSLGVRMLRFAKVGLAGLASFEVRVSHGQFSSRAPVPGSS